MIAWLAKKHQSASISNVDLIRKLRKPLAPPIKVKEDKRRYKRAREYQLWH
jgi:hypothetical protein